MSMDRHCIIYLASDGRWFLELGDREGDGPQDSTAYGPFPSMKAAEAELAHHGNLGRIRVDGTGMRAAPTKSRNGRPLVRH
jgi:hypothetical protein